ncbi:MAG: DEAD/DEAH box helicase, partial [Verrucomicrobiae bacterium]|nr:DEAD/DEAH box helicase [Verrucomicrobiae bacterium]
MPCATASVEQPTFGTVGRMESGPDLPILAARDELTRALRTYPRLLLTAPTGSGKSTQVPQFILDDLLRPEEGVVVLQPRRLACRLLARWVATQRGTRLGEEVGYQVRFESCIGPRTRLRYVTEGLLLRQLLTKPALPDVRAVVLDEFHERHLEADLMLGLLRRLQETERPDLLLVVMSATLDVASLRDYLAPCEVRSVTGRQYPVEISYLAKPLRDEPIWDVVATQLDRPFEGDVLVFMPGSYEIQRTIRAIQERHGGRFIVLPLHGDLPVRDQEAALARYDRPKIVVAT